MSLRDIIPRSVKEEVVFLILFVLGIVMIYALFFKVMEFFFHQVVVEPKREEIVVGGYQVGTIVNDDETNDSSLRSHPAAAEQDLRPHAV